MVVVFILGFGLFIYLINYFEFLVYVRFWNIEFIRVVLVECILSIK